MLLSLLSRRASALACVSRKRAVAANGTDGTAVDVFVVCTENRFDSRAPESNTKQWNNTCFSQQCTNVNTIYISNAVTRCAVNSVHLFVCELGFET